MKIKKGYTLRSLGKEFILIVEGLEAEVDFSRMISLNESAAFLWKEVVDKDFDAEMMTSLLVDNYDIDRETAQNDVTALLKSWSDAGIIEE
ncbi:MAG: PqqD family protein [Bacteroidales bacterium]|jgi:hypothetical protein|nr:PqqD family protein [Bacteroidales bacterium]